MMGGIYSDGFHLLNYQVASEQIPKELLKYLFLTESGSELYLDSLILIA